MYQRPFGAVVHSNVPMTIYLATKTIAAINVALEADQGATYRQLLKQRIGEAGDAYSGKGDDFRSHLGASMIGRECTRELFYNWRWVQAAHFDGKTLRLFNRGHLEEPRFVAMLQMIGTQVWQHDQKGDQFRVSYLGGHFGSAIDSVLDGCPDVPNGPALSEFKTHGEKSFKKLESEGVRSSKWEHYVQQQIYMDKYSLPWSLYLAVNKNTDDLYGEIVAYEPSIAGQFIDRAQKIIFTRSVPERLSESPGFYKCKQCSYNRICHLKEPVAKNCRTCNYSEPRQDGSWFCIGHRIELTKETQLQGCENWELMEALR